MTTADHTPTDPNAENAPGDASTRTDFIRAIIDADRAAAKHGGAVVTRFPPEPNGYLHVGHAKSICLNFGLAEAYGGRCHLRFDDTNPLKEEAAFAEAIERDIRWLGFDWGEHQYHASDYYQRLHDFAVELIGKGLAYVDHQTPDEIRTGRGTLTEPGTTSPYRDRSVEENLDEFRKMRDGDYPDGACVLRAKIDMASPNMNLRDPTIYRVRRATHHRTGDAWCIYPMYDFAHGLSDAIEGVTHSICTLEFEDHRPLYDWFLEVLDVPHRPQQIEFARLNLSYTVTSKRKLKQLVDEGVVDGWDDPRMPTISGMRRRGFPPEALRAMCERVGVTKFNSLTDVALLEHFVRDELNRTSPRYMAVLDPVRVVITNWPEGHVDELEAVNNPEDPAAGKRIVPFSGELWIERADFMKDPPRKFHRLGPGREVRLRWAYFMTCDEAVEDPDTGEITELRCTYDPATRGGDAPDGRKVKGTIHWVSAAHALDAEVRLYDRLFTVERPGKDRDEDQWMADLNPDALQVVTGAKLEPSLAATAPGDRMQFERVGYFCRDVRDGAERLVFNRTIALRDSWAKAGKG